jgi:galactokinase
VPQAGLVEALCAEFARRFGRPPERVVRAPGRVNLIGEHTDYNEGLVLPCAIDRDTFVAAAARADGAVRVFSRELGAEAAFAAAAPRRRGDWVDYVAAPFWALREAGRTPGGADLGVASDVPRESGLSSSAALGVGVVTALDRVLGLGLAPAEAASLAHRGESDFVGVGCGIMDQWASALGRRDHALRIDCRDRSVRAVPLGTGLRILIAASGVRRALAAGGYRARVEECARAFAAARAAGVAPPGARALRDLGPDDLPALSRALDPLLFRRARHVVTESPRVDAVCAALGRGDLAAVGALLREGMRSLRDDFDVSTPELDALCAIGDAQPGCMGSRLTGAGFGGCTVHLVRPDAAEGVRDALAAGFAARFGRRPAIVVVRAADGAGDAA